MPQDALQQRKLFCFGYGYSAQHLARLLQPQGFAIAGTTTDPDKRAAMAAAGIEAYLFDAQNSIHDIEDVLADVTHVLLSIPPQAEGDPVFDLHALDLARAPALEWAGYLSTTGVYGNQDGNWVDESTPVAATSRRGDLRARAEQQWQGLYFSTGFPLHVFRLSGIYGPGRSALDSVRSGHAQCIDKPGHMFNRIHVEDIAQVLGASMAQPAPGEIYNLADDCPAASHEVIGHACDLLGLSTPPMVPYEEAELAPMMRSFYKDNKKVRNAKIKEKLGVVLRYPDFRAGLEACLSAESAA